MRYRPVCWIVCAWGLVLVASPASALGVPAAAPSSAPLATWQAQGRVSAFAISNGVVYLGGSFTSLFSHGTRKAITRNHLAAINEKTGVPTAWNPNANGAVHALRVIGSRVYVGGSFTSIGGRSVRNLAAVGRGNGRVIAGFRASANGEVDALAASTTTLYWAGRLTCPGPCPR